VETCSDEDERAQGSADTTIDDQAMRCQHYSRRIAVAKRPVWCVSFQGSIRGGCSSGKSPVRVPLLDCSQLLRNRNKTTCSAAFEEFGRLTAAIRGATMNDAWTKADLNFLVDAMERKRTVSTTALFAVAPDLGATDKVQGKMSIPDPVTVDVNGTMTESDYKACSMVMAVCQNMVQKTLTDAAKAAGVAPSDALKDMNAWVQAYVGFPFPIFNFKDTQSDLYKNDKFSLKVDADVVEQIVNIKGLAGLKDAVIGALKASGGNLLSYEGTDRHFNYFGVITGYNETEISTRVIKFQMNLKTTKVDSLCVHYAQTNLDTSYDTYQFTADKDLMIKIQAKIGEQVVDEVATKLLEFVKSFYESQLKSWTADLQAIIKKNAGA
jgi:hypothetical protein